MPETDSPDACGISRLRPWHPPRRRQKSHIAAGTGLRAARRHTCRPARSPDPPVECGLQKSVLSGVPFLLFLTQALNPSPLGSDELKSQHRQGSRRNEAYTSASVGPTVMGPCFRVANSHRATQMLSWLLSLWPHLCPRVKSSGVSPATLRKFSTYPVGKYLTVSNPSEPGCTSGCGQSRPLNRNCPFETLTVEP